jgi:hypothetical protein
MTRATPFSYAMTIPDPGHFVSTRTTDLRIRSTAAAL